MFVDVFIDLHPYHAAHLGDFDPELHDKTTDYITEFKFIPNQVCALKL